MYTRNKVNLTITTILLVSALIIMLAPFYFWFWKKKLRKSLALGQSGWMPSVLFGRKGAICESSVPQSPTAAYRSRKSPKECPNT